MKHFILTKVHSSSVATEPKDLEKGLGFIAVLEATKRIGDIVVPDFIKCKSAIKLEAGEQLLEVEVFNKVSSLVVGDNQLVFVQSVVFQKSLKERTNN